MRRALSGEARATPFGGPSSRARMQGCRPPGGNAPARAKAGVYAGRCCAAGESVERREARTKSSFVGERWAGIEVSTHSGRRRFFLRSAKP